VTGDRRPVGVTLLSAFCVFGAAMATLTCLALLTPGGPLEPIWRLNPQAQTGFRDIHPWGIPLMAVVAIVCVVAARGLWIRARWGLRLAIAGLAVNGVSDVLGAVLRHDPRTLIGVPIVGLLLVYLSRPSIRRQFSVGNEP
jgi:hypothetical protein